MKRRIFLTAGTIAGSGILAKANSLGQLNHLANLQMLDGDQVKQLKNFEQQMATNLKLHKLSPSKIKAFTRINKIVKNERKGNDYHLSFYNDKDKQIDLIAKKGEFKTIIL